MGSGGLQAWSGLMVHMIRIYGIMKFSLGFHAYRSIRILTCPGEYAPASYFMLWPFVGWLDFRQVRWLWAAISALSLGGLMHLIVKESGENSTGKNILSTHAPFRLSSGDNHRQRSKQSTFVEALGSAS